ncbi:MAG: 30S ribosomal protein S12 methylthiotransferase RimO [Defluviitaleaceae bacterium]|nr:30S ribosomal protein S12 methylthiotransferase RimO [Defluviitaleaceae bacterium]
MNNAENKGTFYLHSLGCDKNLIDSEIMLGLLKEDGYTITTEPSQADLIVVNTCGFIEEAVEEGINAILQMSTYKDEKNGRCKTLIVTGCMAQRYNAEIKKTIPEVDKIIGTAQFPTITASGKNFDVLDSELYAKRITTIPMHVAYVKISEGCDNNCTYCTIPSIKGRYRDREFSSIITECTRLIANGAKELVLVAQDTARYGTELYNRPRLHELLERITQIPETKKTSEQSEQSKQSEQSEQSGLVWVRVMYAYPEHIYDDLISTIANTAKIAKYIDMPIQHSNNRIIQKMGRKSNTAALLQLTEKLRQNGIAIRTTLITGFPGETTAEFAEMCGFIKQVQFKHLGVFAYSQEKGTPAAKMPKQLAKSTKEERKNKLLTLQAEISQKNNEKLIGKILTIMVDGIISEDADKIAYSGRSQYDAYDVDGAVFFDAPAQLMSGDIVQIKILKSTNYDLYGEFCGIMIDEVNSIGV